MRWRVLASAARGEPVPQVPRVGRGKRTAPTRGSEGEGNKNSEAADLKKKMENKEGNKRQGDSRALLVGSPQPEYLKLARGSAQRPVYSCQ